MACRLACHGARVAARSRPQRTLGPDDTSRPRHPRSGQHRPRRPGTEESAWDPPSRGRACPGTWRHRGRRVGGDRAGSLGGSRRAEASSRRVPGEKARPWATREVRCPPESHTRPAPRREGARLVLRCGAIRSAPAALERRARRRNTPCAITCCGGWRPICAQQHGAAHHPSAFGTHVSGSQWPEPAPPLRTTLPHSVPHQRKAATRPARGGTCPGGARWRALRQHPPVRTSRL